jgi:hypothetical protein
MEELRADGLLFLCIYTVRLPDNTHTHISLYYINE